MHRRCLMMQARCDGRVPLTRDCCEYDLRRTRRTSGA
jgi:hypothetical protein